MTTKQGKSPKPLVIHYPKTDDAQLTDFRRVIGSIALTGPVPSKYFLDDEDERPDGRTRD
jgi:hypothetical protein